jgi:hypothetical protein
MLALMETEVSGPRLPGPMSFTTSYFPAISQRKALDCLKNYSVEELGRLLPNHQVVQHGNAQRTTITGEDLTQESYIVNEYPLLTSTHQIRTRTLVIATMGRKTLFSRVAYLLKNCPHKLPSETSSSHR